MRLEPSTRVFLDGLLHVDAAIRLLMDRSTSGDSVGNLSEFFDRSGLAESADTALGSLDSLADPSRQCQVVQGSSASLGRIETALRQMIDSRTHPTLVMAPPSTPPKPDPPLVDVAVVGEVSVCPMTERADGSTELRQLQHLAVERIALGEAARLLEALERAAVDHHDPLTHRQGRQSVRDHEHGRARRELTHRLAHECFGTPVEGARRLVEDDDVGVVDERAGDAEPRPLTAREARYRARRPARRDRAASARRRRAGGLSGPRVRRRRRTHRRGRNGRCRRSCPRTAGDPARRRSRAGTSRRSTGRARHARRRRTAPAVGSRRRRMSETSVDLPAPDGPTMPMISPLSTLNDTFDSTR